MLTILTLLACGGALGRHDTATFPEDTSYRGEPMLRSVSVTCEGDATVFRARTIGWTEEGAVDVWGDDDGDGVRPHASLEISTTGFRQDEYCDVLEARVTTDSWPTGQDSFECSDVAEGRMTVLFRTWFEEGCAGARAYGPAADLTYDEDTDPAYDPPIRPMPDTARKVPCIPSEADTAVIRNDAPGGVPGCAD